MRRPIHEQWLQELGREGECVPCEVGLHIRGEACVVNGMTTAHKYDRITGREHVNVANGAIRSKTIFYTFMTARLNAEA